MKHAFALIALLGFAVPAHAACQLKSDLAPVCTSGLNAVRAYRVYGGDISKLRSSNNQYLLQQAGCYTIHRGGPPIFQMNHGRVAFTDGWVGVTTVSVGKGGGLIADAYLEGKCETYKPEKFTLPPLVSAPDFSR